MNWIIKNWPSLLLLAAGILAAIATYVSQKRSDKQQDDIETLGKLNKELGDKNLSLAQQIHQLNTINNQIAGNIENLTKKNNELARQNNETTAQSKLLIEKVDELTSASYSVINKLDSKTDEEFAVTGNFNFKYSGQVEVLAMVIGQNFVPASPEQFPEFSGLRDYFPSVPFDFIKIKFSDNELFISTTLYDLDGNWIAEIDSNMWRVNKNLISKFNYDERGFEIFDSRGRMIIGITGTKELLTTNYTLFIQGYFVNREEQKVFISTLNDKIRMWNLDRAEWYQSVNDYLNRVKMISYFQYTGEKWRGVRINE